MWAASTLIWDAPTNGKNLTYATVRCTYPKPQMWRVTPIVCVSRYGLSHVKGVHVQRIVGHIISFLLRTCIREREIGWPGSYHHRQVRRRATYVRRLTVPAPHAHAKPSSRTYAGRAGQLTGWDSCGTWTGSAPFTIVVVPPECIWKNDWLVPTC